MIRRPPRSTPFPYTTLSRSSVLANDTDAEANTLTAAKLSDPAHGSVTLNADGTFSYSHDGSETASDSFTYKACDNGTTNGSPDGKCSGTATVSITVTPVNDAPGAPTALGGATTLSTAPANEGGQTLAFIVGNDNNGLFSGQPAISSTGTLPYTPATRPAESQPSQFRSTTTVAPPMAASIL